MAELRHSDVAMVLSKALYGNTRLKLAGMIESSDPAALPGSNELALLSIQAVKSGPR
jgi:hypothetical protein